ncbi:AP2 domain-containing protein [Metabacillus litoralis]|uniref:AP2 domain-containing protein n=1 Tax=Metabacillus litoralis TaxID=152268 RepID=UPI00203ECDFB|nr:AP2 domain-containing protein [Metabacillus litoralis]MCM3651295.1 AP2 domain-containing protein [Metabacillus litoralis]
MINGFEIREDITAIFLNGKHGEMETLIDTIDLPRAQEFEGRWYPIRDRRTKSFYVGGSLKLEPGKWTTIQLHRWITNAPPNMLVDHYNHQTLDNRHEHNLRLCSIGENNRNRQVSSGSSKYKGVDWHNFRKKYRARIKVNSKSIHLGHFDTELEAALAYNRAAIEHHGAFAKLNNLT